MGANNPESSSLRDELFPGDICNDIYNSQVLQKFCRYGVSLSQIIRFVE